MPAPEVRPVYRAKLIRVMTGDLIDLDVDLGLDVKRSVRAELAGVECPKVFGPMQDQGVAARDFTVGWFNHHANDDRCLVEMVPGLPGNYAAKVYGLDGSCLNDELVIGNHATKK
jgi:hypothetical protein